MLLNIWATFCKKFCSREFSKIAQSGRTDTDGGTRERKVVKDSRHEIVFKANPRFCKRNRTFVAST